MGPLREDMDPHQIEATVLPLADMALHPIETTPPLLIATTKNPLLMTFTMRDPLQEGAMAPLQTETLEELLSTGDPPPTEDPQADLTSLPLMNIQTLSSEAEALPQGMATKVVTHPLKVGLHSLLGQYSQNPRDLLTCSRKIDLFH